MNVIFLDVDGVISSKRRANHIDEARLGRLIAVAMQTNSRIVVSSHWRLVPKLHSSLRAAIRYFGVEVIGATPVRKPQEPERPLEIREWLEAYNAHAQQLGRPPVSSFVAIDDRDLLTERGGEALVGHFVHTDTNLGLTQEAAQQVIELFGGGTAAVPGLNDVEVASALNEPFVGEVRLVQRPTPSEPAPSELLRYSCTLAFKDPWSGAKIACGDGTGRRPSGWIVIAADGASASSNHCTIA